MYLQTSYFKNLRFANRYYTIQEPKPGLRNIHTET